MRCYRGLIISGCCIILLISCCLCLKAQIKKTDSKCIIGNWVTVGDEKSKLSFNKNFAYQLYAKDTIDKYIYKILDSSNSTVVNIPLMRLIRMSKENNDTTYYAIQNLSSKWLSLFEITYTKQIWLLKRK